ncbi:hypothetical protein D9615_005794 [Tricholomella constricta]|uniref:Mucoidy inhibitor A n=1 Tax=Tricholomella constricta TaxID=117010 RepID=A0A8H5M3T3_9AGAR|nr:hypothetical protein D9615_005794 [Tricholomella constricta]
MATTIPSLKINAPDHPIKSVTIFKSSKAEVVRQFTLNLKVGQNKIEIKGLPSIIDTHSVRVSGLGDARLYDVVCTVGANNDASYASDSIAEIIRLLQVKKVELENEKRVRRNEADLLVDYAKTLTGEHVPPTQMNSFLESFVEQGRKNLRAITELSEKIIQVDRQIERENKKKASKKGEALGEVNIILGADETSKVDLKLTYIVSNVFWKPTYELHATMDNGKPSSSVALHYRARITQSTGEDWTNTALTLSTLSSDTIAKSIPQLIPVKLRPRPLFGSNTKGGYTAFQNAAQRQIALFPPQQQQQQQQPTGGLFGAGPTQMAATGVFGSSNTAPSSFSAAFPQSYPGGASAFGVSASVSHQMPPPPNPSFAAEEMFEEIAAPDPTTEPTTFVNETPVAISFSITGESTIPSDGIDHQVSVAVLPLEAKVSYVTIPRIEPRVYLHCQVKNSSEYRLLAGPVSVILDDSYVSKTSISDVSTGDDFDCTLGDDAETKVTYSRTARTVKSESGAFTETTNTTTHMTKITIYNKHTFAIPELVVRDAVPTCDDKRARIILRKPEGLADAKDGEEVDIKGEAEGLRAMWGKLVDGKGGEKEGKFEWRTGIKAKDKVMLEAQWEVKAPADSYWAESLQTTS